MKKLKGMALAVGLVLSTGFVMAQQSASFRLNEHTFNAGGRPAGGITAGSAHFGVTLDAIGSGVFPAPLSSGAFAIGGGFVAAYPPPIEVTGLRFTGKPTLVWNPEPSVGAYHLYRGGLASIAGLSYGACRTSAIAGTTTSDSDPVIEGNGFYYLVTARNNLWEEGTKGSSSEDVERGNAAPCP